jgi:hypothetical protein
VGFELLTRVKMDIVVFPVTKTYRSGVLNSIREMKPFKSPVKPTDTLIRKMYVNVSHKIHTHTLFY